VYSFWNWLESSGEFKVRWPWDKKEDERKRIHFGKIGRYGKKDLSKGHALFCRRFERK
jgi:hypothetical protein